MERLTLASYSSFKHPLTLFGTGTEITTIKLTAVFATNWCCYYKKFDIQILRVFAARFCSRIKFVI